MTTHQNNQFTTQKQEVFFPPNITFKDIGFTLTSAIHPGYGTGRFGRQLILTCLVLIVTARLARRLEINYSTD